MLYSFDKKLLGFCENKKIKSLPLYVFSDLKYLDSMGYLLYYLNILRML